MQTIYLDISNKGVVPVIYAKQGDVGRKVEVILTNSGLPYEPEAGSAFSAWYSGASGVGNYTDIGDHSAFSVSGNKVTVELIAQMLQNGGEGILCLVLSRANGEQIGLWNIRYICEGIPGAGSDPAKDYYTAFSQAVAGLPYPDASLSVAGKSADAAATGKALEGKAPAGYGLGEYGSDLPQVADADTCHRSGWYFITGATVNGIGATAVMRVDSYSSTHIVQTAYCGNWTSAYFVIQQRIKHEGEWGEWEWKNPPMIPGNVYRTTKRHGGKPVYTYCIAANIGLEDAGGYRTRWFNHLEAAASMVDIISVKAKVHPIGSNSNQVLPAIGSDGTTSINAFNTGFSIYSTKATNVDYIYAEFEFTIE